MEHAQTNEKEPQRASNTPQPASPEKNSRNSRSDSSSESQRGRRREGNNREKETEHDEQKQNKEEEPRRQRSNSSRSPPRTTQTSLYVGNLSSDVTEANLKEKFSTHGRVVSASMVLNPATGESRGFAFVAFEDRREAMDALNALNRTKFLGRELIVEPSNRKAGYKPTPGRYLGSRRSRDGRNDHRRGRYKRSESDERRGGRRGRRDFDDGHRHHRRRSRSRDRREPRDRDSHRHRDRSREREERRRRRSDSKEERRKRSDSPRHKRSS